MNKKGSTALKKKKRPTKKKKKKKDERMAEEPFHSHMNRRNVSYVQGAKC